MTKPTAPSIQTMNQFNDAISAYRLPGVLATAVTLDVFTRMGEKTWTPKALAGALKANARAVEILLRNLATVGLVRKRGAAYVAGPLGRTCLNRRSPDYQGALLDLFTQHWESWIQLAKVVKTGKPAISKSAANNRNPAYLRSFTWAMHQRSLKAAQETAAQLNLNSARSLLDVGGGPGTYALEFLKTHSSLRAGVWDRPAALAVARRIAKPLRHGARLSCYPGDFFDDPVPGRFDVMWVSNVIHMFSPAENTTLFRKLKRALNPGGRLLIQDTFLMNKPGFNELATNLFAATMLMYTPTGNTYAAGDVGKWLTTAGFQRSRCLQLKRGTGDWDGVIIEAVRR